VAFTLASYNVLADAYLRRGWYPKVPPELLERRRRRAALLERVAGLGADVLCLQEVEKGALADLAERLRPLGYLVHHARKAAGKPDGCATLVRAGGLAVRAVERLAFADAHDGDGASGHVALFVTLEHEGRLVCVVNTHVRWDPPGTPAGGGWAPRQLGAILARRSVIGGDAGGGGPAEWIVCGDLNLRPDSPVLDLLRGAGLRDSHAGQERRHTCFVNGRAVTIDYLWHSPGLRAEPAPLPPLGDDTPLPSPAEPSDHVPVVARFAFAAPAL
jgi:mRNA deadenylase 3'-5' endonuclease subunit Ccr4